MSRSHEKGGKSCLASLFPRLLHFLPLSLLFITALLSSPSLSLSLFFLQMAMQASLLLPNFPSPISSSKTTTLPSPPLSHGRHLSVRASALMKKQFEAKETHLYSISPLPLLFFAALPGGNNHSFL